jgi:hypothetical protein
MPLLAFLLPLQLPIHFHRLFHHRSHLPAAFLYNGVVELKDLIGDVIQIHEQKDQLSQVRLIEVIIIAKFSEGDPTETHNNQFRLSLRFDIGISLSIFRLYDIIKSLY